MSELDRIDAPEAESEAPARPGLGQAFSAPLRIFYAPSGVYTEVRDGLAWWPGLVLMMILAISMSVMLLPLQQELMVAEVQSGAMKGLELTEDGELPAPIRYGIVGTAVAGGLLAVPVVLLIISFFYWLALLVTFGGAPFRKIFSLAIYTSFIGLAFQIINTIYLTMADLEMTGMSDFQESALDLSLGALMAEPGFLTNVLRFFGVFQVWELVLFLSGVAVVMSRKRSAVLGPILVVAVLGALVVGFMGTLGEMSMKIGG